MNANEEIEMYDHEIVTIKCNLAAARLGLAISAYTKNRFAKRVTIKVDGNGVQVSLGGKQYHAVVWTNNQDAKGNAELFKKTVDFDGAMLTRFADESALESRLINPTERASVFLQADFKNLLIRAILASSGTDLGVRTEASFSPFLTDGTLVILSSGEEFSVTLLRIR